MSLANVSPAAVAAVCADLALALAGVHPFGGNVAEVYAFRLDRARPALECGGLHSLDLIDRAVASHAALSVILATFAVVLPAGWTITVDGMPLHEWQGAPGNAHRYRVAFVAPGARA